MHPFQKFGKALTAIRRQYHATKQEVCGALEIDIDTLQRLEQGVEQPSEDVIEQFISHFDLNDYLADSLWLLGGYPAEKVDEATVHSIAVPVNELKINYTDMVHVSVNNFGVVLNFMQTSGPNNQPMVVSRLGMSKEHAKSLVDLIQTTMQSAEESKAVKLPKTLPASLD